MASKQPVSCVGGGHLDTRRIDYLDGIRGLAVAMVVGYHWVGRYAPLGDGGYIGVDVFFVLSGYIITTMLWRSTRDGRVHQQMAAFLRRRVRRLYPALLGFVLGGGLIFGVLPGLQISTADIVQRAAVALTQTTSLWMTEDTSRWAPYGQTWSLADEWFFYLLWPILLFMTKRADVPARTASRWSAVGAVGLYASALGLSGWHFYVYPVARGGEMLAGAALALAMLDRGELPRTPSRVPWTAISYVALVAVSCYAVFGPHFATPVFRWVGLPLSAGATLILIRGGGERGGGVLERLMTWSPLTLLGRVSYSLYLWHLVPVWGLDRDSWPVSPILLALGGVAFTALATTLSYLLLERPFLSSQAGLLRRQPALSPSPSANAESGSAGKQLVPRQRRPRGIRRLVAGSDRLGEPSRRP